jgi:PAS domain S-box-containing protein
MSVPPAPWLAVAFLGAAARGVWAQGAALPPAPDAPIPVAAALATLGRGDTVVVAGRVTADASVYQRRALYAPLQNGATGLWLFARQPAPGVRAGDSVVARGVVQRYRGTTELIVTDLRVVRAARRMPAPVEARADGGVPAAAREGRLLRVRGVAGAQGVSEGGRWLRLHVGAPRSATPAGDSVTVWVPATHAHPPALEDVRPGDRLDVVGVGGVYQDNPSDPSVAQLLPRAPDDLRIVGLPKRWTELAGAGLLACSVAGLAVFGAARLLTRRHERAARETEARYRQLLALSPDAVIVHAGGEVLFANAAAARLLGAPDERALAGCPVSGFADATARDELDAAARGDGQRARTRFVRADETLVDVEVAASACRYNDRPAVVIVARDVGARLRYERELRELALLDELTGLHNRRGFLTFAESELRRAQRLEHDALLVFADLDGLKAINDRHGHAAGDAALCGVARALRDVVGAQGLVARWSGDEFVALLPKPGGATDEWQAVRVAPGGAAAADAGDPRDAAAAERLERQLRAALARQAPPAPGVTLSASLGVRHLPADGGESLAAALSAADAGLYRRRAEARQR